jgi:hypothetical protein
VSVPPPAAATLSVDEPPVKILVGTASGSCVMMGGLQTSTVIVSLFAKQTPSEVTRHQ